MEIERAKELIKAIINYDRVAAVLMVLEEHSRSVSTKLDNLALENMRRELDEVKMELKDTHKQFEVLAGIIEEHQRCHIESERRESVKEKTMEAVEKIKERNKKGNVVNGIHLPAKEEQVDNRICKKCGKSFYSESGKGRVCPACKKTVKDFVQEVADKEKSVSYEAGINVNIKDLAKELIEMEEGDGDDK